MKLLVDYDDQYLIQKVEKPLWHPPKHRWKADPKDKLPRDLSPQMLRLISILEEKFLGRWAYVKEYRETLRQIDIGEKNTIKQVFFRLGKEKADEAHRMWEKAMDEFWEMSDNGIILGEYSCSPSPTYRCPHGASDTGPSAYALFRRRRTVLVRAGILRVKRAVKRRVEELIGRPLHPTECVLEGPKRGLMQLQVTTAITRGELGGMVVDLDFLGNPRWALAVRHDAPQFNELLARESIMVITDYDGYKDFVEKED